MLEIQKQNKITFARKGMKSLLEFLEIPKELYAGKGKKNSFYLRNFDNLEYLIDDFRPYYLKMVKKYHPDISTGENAPNNENMIRDINFAWDEVTKRINNFLNPKLAIPSPSPQKTISKKTKEEAKCKRCQSVFVKEAKKRLFCSKRCSLRFHSKQYYDRLHSQKRQEKKKCKGCGSDFVDIIKTSPSVFCSKKCRTSYFSKLYYNRNKNEGNKIQSLE